MTTTSTLVKAILIAVIFVALSTLALSANAGDRVTVDRGREASGRTITTPTPPPPAPAPVSVPPSPNQSGGITNVTTGEVSSGGNTGGNVTTGDEHVEVFVVNVGPTNTSNSTDATSGGQSDPAPTGPPCSGDRRAPDACIDSGTTRAR